MLLTYVQLLSPAELESFSEGGLTIVERVLKKCQWIYRVKKGRDVKAVSGFTMARTRGGRDLLKEQWASVTEGKLPSLWFLVFCCCGDDDMEWKPQRLAEESSI